MTTLGSLQQCSILFHTSDEHHNGCYVVPGPGVQRVAPCGMKSTSSHRRSNVQGALTSNVDGLVAEILGGAGGAGLNGDRRARRYAERTNGATEHTKS